jgi:hypothetical protein
MDSDASLRQRRGMHRSDFTICVAGMLAAWVLFARETAQAQALSFGIKGGVPLTDAVDASYGNRAAAKRYTLGPSIEIVLPFSFGLEVSGLYRRTGYNTSTGYLGQTSLRRVRANSWEFPFLVKYYLPPRSASMRPYVSGGYSLRNLSHVQEFVHEFGRDYLTGEPFDKTYIRNGSYLLIDNPTHGATLGGGMLFRNRRLRIAPEIRYTRWSGYATFLEAGPRGYFVLSAANQWDLLLSLTF